MLSLVLVVHKSMKVTRIYWRKNTQPGTSECLIFVWNNWYLQTTYEHWWTTNDIKAFFCAVKLCFVKYQQLTRWSEHNYVSFRCCLSVRRKEGTANPVHSVHLGPSYRISISEKLSNTKQSFKSRGDESKSDVGVARKIT